MKKFIDSYLEPVLMLIGVVSSLLASYSLWQKGNVSGSLWALSTFFWILACGLKEIQIRAKNILIDKFSK
jgi:hypothetical protein